MGVTYWKGKFLSACLQDYLENVNPDVFIEDDAVELAKLVRSSFILCVTYIYKRREVIINFLLLILGKSLYF